MTQRARPKELWCPAVYLLLGLYLASLLVFTFRPVIGWPIPQSLGRASTLLIWAFALGHALWTLGWRHALVFFALAFFIGFTFEAVGIATGWVYGDYHYGPRLGPVMLGVPVLIPLSWFTVIYLALAVTERLADVIDPVRARQDDVGDAMGAEEGDLIGEERPVEQRDDRLGALQRERPKPGALAAGQDDGLGHLGERLAGVNRRGPPRDGMRLRHRPGDHGTASLMSMTGMPSRMGYALRQAGQMMRVSSKVRSPLHAGQTRIALSSSSIMCPPSFEPCHRSSDASFLA